MASPGQTRRTDGEVALALSEIRGMAGRLHSASETSHKDSGASAGIE